MKIAVVGYGQLGQEVVSIAKEKNIDVPAIIDPFAEAANYRQINNESLRDIDVCVDTSTPVAVLANIDSYIMYNKNCVIATTGWYEYLEEIKNKIRETDLGLLWSSNFSIGANLFFRIIDFASKILGQNELYDVFAQEIHHRFKQDNPSGTAQRIGEILLKNIPGKNTILYETMNRKIHRNELNFTSVRGGFVPGIHNVFFDSEFDTIEISHTLRNRRSLALGVITGAQWVKGKRGFFDINNMLDELI